MADTPTSGTIYCVRCDAPAATCAHSPQTPDAAATIDPNLLDGADLTPDEYRASVESDPDGWL